MTSTQTKWFALGLTLTMSATPGLAQPNRHLMSPTGYRYRPQADIIARRTAEAQKEPGVTSELAPDAKQTATGGPVGGVPGYEGN